MVSIILAAVLFGGITLAGVRFLFRHVRQFFRWRRDTLMRPWQQLLLILPPLALSLVVFGGPLSAVPEEYPAQLGDLQEVTAPVDMVREYETHQATGRSIRIVKRYYIYLEGYEGSLYIPDEFRFDQEDFLRWAGSEEVTFLYARTDGRLTIYQIQRGDQVFLDYARARERLTVTFLADLLMMLAALLFGLGGSIYLPEFLSPKDRSKRTERILGLIFAALLVTVIVLLYGLLNSQPKITESFADTSGLLTEKACLLEDFSERLGENLQPDSPPACCF